MLQFVDRFKTFTHKIILKVHYEIDEQVSCIPLINQVEITTVLVLTANSPPELNTMLMFIKPKTLNDVSECIRMNQNLAPFKLAQYVRHPTWLERLSKL